MSPFSDPSHGSQVKSLRNQREHPLWDGLPRTWVGAAPRMGSLLLWDHQSPFNSVLPDFLPTVKPLRE